MSLRRRVYQLTRYPAGLKSNSESFLGWLIVVAIPGLSINLHHHVNTTRPNHTPGPKPSYPRRQPSPHQHRLLARSSRPAPACRMGYRGVPHLRRSLALPLLRRRAPVCSAAEQRLYPLCLLRRAGALRHAGTNAYRR